MLVAGSMRPRRLLYLLTNSREPLPGPAPSRIARPAFGRSPAGIRARPLPVPGDHQDAAAGRGRATVRAENPDVSDRRGPSTSRTPTSVSAGGRCSKPGEGLGGQGRGRTADLPIFSRTLVPTELPGLGIAAVLTGLEPATSALTGRRALQLLHRTLLAFHVACPQRDSNPCYRLERAASWATRRWGQPRQYCTSATPHGLDPNRAPLEA